jgi:hypothetical protein
MLKYNIMNWKTISNELERMLKEELALLATDSLCK